MYSQRLLPQPIRYTGAVDSLRLAINHPKLLSGQSPSFTQILALGSLRWTRNSPHVVAAENRSPNTGSASTAATTSSRTGGEPSKPLRRSIQHSNHPRPQQTLYPRTPTFPNHPRKPSCLHFRWPPSWKHPAMHRSRRRGESS